MSATQVFVAEWPEHQEQVDDLAEVLTGESDVEHWMRRAMKVVEDLDTAVTPEMIEEVIRTLKTQDEQK